MFVRRVFAGATDGSPGHERHVMVTHALTAAHLTWKQDRSRLRNLLKICSMLFVSEKNIYIYNTDD